MTEGHALYHSIFGSLLCIVKRSWQITAFAATFLRSYVSAPTTVNMTKAKQL